MNYSANTKLSQILSENPWLAQELPKRNTIFQKLQNPAARLLLGRMTVQDASRLSGESVDYLLGELEQVFREHEKGSGTR